MLVAISTFDTPNFKIRAMDDASDTTGALLLTGQQLSRMFAARPCTYMLQLFAEYTKNSMVKLLLE
jgi:hypothetical protein